MLAYNLRTQSAPHLTPETVPADNLWGGGYDPSGIYDLAPRSYAAIKRGAVVQCVDVLDRLGADAVGEQIADSANVYADLDARMRRSPLRGLIDVADDPVWAFIPERQAI